MMGHLASRTGRYSGSQCVSWLVSLPSSPGAVEKVSGSVTYSGRVSQVGSRPFSQLVTRLVSGSVG